MELGKHFVVALVGEVEEASDVEGQLRGVLQEEQHQPQPGQTAWWEEKIKSVVL